MLVNKWFSLSNFFAVAIVLLVAGFFIQAADVRAEEPQSAVYTNNLALWYANEYGDYVATETVAIPEYTNSLALMYANQYGNVETAVVDTIEYTDFLAQFYAEQYASQIAPQVVQVD